MKSQQTSKIEVFCVVVECMVVVVQNDLEAMGIEAINQIVINKFREVINNSKALIKQCINDQPVSLEHLHEG